MKIIESIHLIQGTELQKEYPSYFVDPASDVDNVLALEIVVEQVLEKSTRVTVPCLLLEEKWPHLQMV